MTVLELTSSDMQQPFRHGHTPLSNCGEFRWGRNGYVGPIPQLPRSKDLTPLDFNLWGFVKAVVTFLPYLQPAAFPELQEEIQRFGISAG